jgi:dTDP-glucose 4,6-dehydratase
MPVWIVRGTNAFGPRQHPEKAIPVFTMAAFAGEKLPIYADGRQSREWLYVTDWVAGCMTALAHGEPGEVFNIGGGHELTNLELARLICELTGADPSLISSVPDRPAHDLRYGITSARLRELAWAPEVSFDDGLARTVEWYRDHRDWVETMRAGAAT